MVNILPIDQVPAVEPGVINYLNTQTSTALGPASFLSHGIDMWQIDTGFRGAGDYEGPLPLGDLGGNSGRTLWNWLQSEGERFATLAPVGFPGFRRALEYTMGISVYFGMWLREFYTWAVLAKAEENSGRELLAEDLSVRELSGSLNAFLLATGDLTVAPFQFPFNRTPSVDEIMSAVLEAILDTNTLDHYGFELGWNTGGCGITAHPTTGQELCLIPSDSITHLLSHPWTKALSNAYVRDSFEDVFQDRRAYLGVAAGELWCLSEGGLQTDYLQDNLLASLGTYQAQFGVGSLQSAGQSTIDVLTNVASPAGAPDPLAIFTCGHCTAVEWIFILRAWKNILPPQVLYIQETLGRIKNTLPSIDAIAMPAGPTIAQLIDWSLTCGNVAAVIPSFNIVTRLSLPGQNGPHFLDSRTTPNWEADPLLWLNMTRWGDMTVGTDIAMKDVDGLPVVLTHAGPNILGDYATMTTSYFLMPGCSPSDVDEGDPTLHAWEKTMLSGPLSGVVAGLGYNDGDFSVNAYVPGASILSGHPAVLQPPGWTRNALTTLNELLIPGQFLPQHVLGSFTSQAPLLESPISKMDAWRVRAFSSVSASCRTAEWETSQTGGESIAVPALTVPPCLTANTNVAPVVQADVSFAIPTGRDWAPWPASVPTWHQTGFAAGAVTPPIPQVATWFYTPYSVCGMTVGNFRLIPRTNVAKTGLEQEGFQSSHILANGYPINPETYACMSVGGVGPGGSTDRAMLVLTGDYLVRHAEEYVGINLLDPLAWMVDTYTGRVDVGDAHNAYSAYNIVANPAISNRPGALGASQYTGLPVPSAHFPVPVPAVTNDCFNYVDWDSDGLAANVPAFSVILRRRRRFLENPWLKEVDTEYGFVRQVYEDMSVADTQVRKGMAAAWMNLNSGLSNDMFRDIQTLF